MKQVLAVIFAAIIASLAACELASNEGIRGIPANLNMWFGGDKTPVVEATLTDSARLHETAGAARDKASDAVAKMKELAEKAIEAAKPKDVAVVESVEDSDAERAHEPGVTTYFGESPSTRVAAWSAAAAMNPDYVAVASDDGVAVQPTAQSKTDDLKPAATGGDATLSYFGMTETPDSERRWAAAATVYETAAVAPETPSEATPSPASNAEATLTYFGAAEKSDSEQPWAAAATVIADARSADQEGSNPETEQNLTPDTAAAATLTYFGTTGTPDAEQPWAAAATVYETAGAASETPSEATPAAAPANDATLTYFGEAEKSDADQPWAAAATVYEAATAAPAGSAEEAPPARPSGEATLSYFGVTETPDAEQSWAAAATVYEVAAGPETPSEATPAAAPANDATLTYFGEAEKSDADQPWAAAATVYETTEAKSAEASGASEEAAAATPTVGAATLSYFGATETPDADQPWAAGAAMNRDYAAAPAMPETATACQQQISAAAKASTVGFTLESARIAGSSHAALDQFASLAKSCGGIIIEVAGFTDSTGDASYNQKLSERRAEAVVGYLVAAGVSPATLKAAGYGESKPLASNETREGRRKNRRIEFSVIPLAHSS
jgi:outer membrane protein OmpA-like peptidoglycan-associated protein